MAKCKFIKPDGTPCQAHATSGGEFCFSHDPQYKEQKALAVRKGGQNRKTYGIYGKTVKIKSPTDVKNLLAKVINGVWTGTLPDNRPAATLGFLSRCFLDAYEGAEVETRLTALEERLGKAGL